MFDQFDLLIDSYLDTQVGFAPLFLSKALSAGLYQNILSLQRDEKLKEAGIGNDEIRDIHQKIRLDKIYWLDRSHSNVFENEFLTLVEQFIDHLNKTCFAGINGYEFHYAVYEEGSFYKRHMDQFKNDNNRKFSLINYLNLDWIEADGGQLLVYKNRAIQSIMPESRSAVFFKSDELEHEVMLTHRPRMSVTGWLKRI